jgi:hypothetical protein
MNFVISDYTTFVQSILDSGYTCRSFSDPLSRDISSRNLLLRHDLDIDPIAALPMARAEAEVGARATYFVLLSNRHTNPFDVEFRSAVTELTQLGHWVGLHFDATQYSVNAESPDFAAAVGKEARWLGQICDVHVDSVSFHRPSRDLISSSNNLTAPLTHTYENVFIREMEYCSDSSGRWAYGPPEERTAIAEGRPFHFLTHPIWWGEIDDVPLSRIGAWMSRRIFDDFNYEVPNDKNPFEGLR